MDTGDRIYAITEDHNDQLWIGTQYGFGMYSPSGGSYAKFYNLKAGNININEITVNSIIEDKNGIYGLAHAPAASSASKVKERCFKIFHKDLYSRKWRSQCNKRHKPAH